MNLFRRRKKAKKDIFEKGDFNIKDINVFEDCEFLVSLIYTNSNVNTIYPACASCYGLSKDKNKEYDKRLQYIGRRIKSDHTSVTEHSNVVIQVFIPLLNTTNLFDSVKLNNENIKVELSDLSSTDQDIVTLLSEVRDVCRYLSIVTDTIKDKDSNPILRMTIGGSIRGFRYIFECIENRHNKLFISIFNVLKLAIEPELFLDFINNGIMYSYNTIEVTSDLIENLPRTLLNTQEDEKLDILNMDDLHTISRLTGLEKTKCFDFVSITADFKNMSRIITQQLTRHRNGITQESQRYVNYSKSCVNNPSQFKDKYDSSKVYITPIGDLTFDDLGTLMSSIYTSLTEQGVDKEDARGYLPQNVQCGHLYMTFTLRTLFKFLDLRLDTHAQAEIREYAKLIATKTINYAQDLNMYNMEDASKVYSLPKYQLDQIDYDLMVEEEI